MFLVDPTDSTDRTVQAHLRAHLRARPWSALLVGRKEAPWGT